jgi:hypothetical protein
MSELKRPLKYSHEAMIDLILTEPSVSNRELAAVFGYSEAWVGHIVKSDSFQARMAERKALLVDPSIKRSVEDRLASVTIKALDKLETVLDSPDVSAATALEALGIGVSGFREA